MDTNRVDIKPSKNLDRTLQVDSCWEYLKQKVLTIKDKKLYRMCNERIKDLNLKNVCGSSGGHHAYPGGLVVHTSEVLEIALKMAEASVLDVNKDFIITAILYHDLGKAEDYRVAGGQIEKTNHYSKIRHLSKSYAMFYSDAFDIFYLDQGQMEEIGHIILSHHGRQDWGSPVEPITIEAYIVHYADMLSSKCAKDYYIKTEYSGTTSKVGFNAWETISYPEYNIPFDRDAMVKKENVNEA